VNGKFGSGGMVVEDTVGEECTGAAEDEGRVVMNFTISLLLSCQVWIALRYAT